MRKIDVHQHLWTPTLITALSGRHELPFVRREHGLTVLYLAGERPYVIDTCSETPARRAQLLELDDLDGALVCLSSPLGIESLPREQSLPLLEAYHDGALALGEPFGVWGAIALDHPDPADVDRLLDRGCIGLSLPAGALAAVDAIADLRAVLERLCSRGAPLFVHPGPGRVHGVPRHPSFTEPLWWPALTSYVAQMQAAWLAFVSVGRREHPELRVIFAMLAGLAPLQVERLHARGGPTPCLSDPRLFYDTSSYGAATVEKLAGVLDAEQLLYGSDRPVIDPGRLGRPAPHDWERIAQVSRRALGTVSTRTVLS